MPEVRKLVKWPTGKRKCGSRKWKKKWVKVWVSDDKTAKSAAKA